MSTTIDSLDIQISTNIGNSATKIDQLANALEKMRNNAGLTKVTNGLNKLAGGINTLKPALAGLEVSKLRSLSTAMNELSGIQKLSGLNSAFNTLKKLPDLVNGLDTVNMVKFTRQMEKLAQALKPLATQIDKVANGFARLPSQVTKAVAATNKIGAATKSATGDLNAGSLNLMSTIANLESVIHVAQMAVRTISGFLSQAIEWDGIQFRFGRAFGEDAEEVYAWVLKINEALGINVQEFMQYSSLYGSLLSGFGMAQEKVTAISVGLTELSYDIWAAYNDRFKSLEDASEAIRSAITGEIEPIRNAGIALTEASLQEYIDSTHLAGVSIEKLTEAQKAEVRYAAMVNAAMNQGIIGTYAREMNTAEGAVRSLSQSFKTLTQALGSLFIPMLQVVVPYVTAFVELLTDAVFWLASLLGIDIQKISWESSTNGVGGLAEGAKDAASGLGSAADAAKKLKSYTMGFDELNVINPDSGSKAGGAGGAGGASGWGEGLDLESIWDEGLLAQASKQVSELKTKIKGWFDEWKTELAIISGALGALGVAKLLSHLGEALSWGDKFLGVLGTIQKVASSGIVMTIQFSLMKEFFGDFMGDDGALKDYIYALLTGGAASWILYKQWGPAGLVLGLGVTAAASLSAVIENGGIDSAESATVALTGFASAIGAVVGAWKLLKKTDVGAFFDLLKEGEPLLGTLAATFPKITNALTSVGGWISKAASSVATFVGGLSGAAIATLAVVVAAVASAAYYLYENWDKVVQAVKDFVKENIAPKLGEIKEHFIKMKNALAPIKKLLKPIVDGISSAFESVKKFVSGINWDEIWSGIKGAIELYGGYLVSIFGGIFGGLINGAVNLVESVVQIFSGIVQVVSGVTKLVVALFTNGDIKGAWEQVWSGLKDIVGGAFDAVFGTLVSVYKGLFDWVASLWEDLGSWYEENLAPKFTTEYWSGVFGTISEALGMKLDELKTTAQTKWTGVTDWFKKNIAPKFTLTYWQTKFNTLVEALGSKLDELKATAGKKWSGITQWFSDHVGPKFTLEYWKGKFNAITAGMSEKLTELKKKAQDKWSEIKSWFSTNVAPKFTKDYWVEKFSGLKDGFVQTIKNMVNSGIELLNRFINRINSTLNFSWEGLEIAGKEVYPGGSVQLFTIPTIAKFENGGFIEDGLFTMNAGEIAGKFTNGRSVVANNEQIIAGISEGVYQAVVAAMNDSQTSGEHPVNVYLDGKQIYSSVKKTEARRGVSIMGNQLGYSY